MAILEVTYTSAALQRNVTFKAFIPVDKQPGDTENKDPKGPFKTLYLLHGMYGDNSDWINQTRILSLAQKKNIAVIMPSAENSFYLDNPQSLNMYGEFIGNEILGVTRDLFHLSVKREDTFIAGLSMGGYGAIRTGLKYNENFSHIAGLSSALMLYEIENSIDGSVSVNNNSAYYEHVLGDLSKVKGSDKDPEALIKSLLDKNAYIPKLYMACGTEDFLIEPNRRYAKFVQSLGIKDFTYIESPGIHDWIFWDNYIEKVLDWLPC